MKPLAHQTKTFSYGTFKCDYKLLKQNRKTFSLTVQPDLSIILKSPLSATDERIELFLKKKWFWIQKQLRYFTKYQHKQYKREYVSGESLYYLGKQYQLIVKRAAMDTVTLQRGKFLLQTVMPEDRVHKKRLADYWFTHRQKEVFLERFEEMCKQFEYKQQPALEVLDMKRRWGSFVNKDKIILNPKLIHVSVDCIDYVIVHELCHLWYKNHDERFFKFLNEKWPKWEKTKEKLESMGVLIQ